jgi:hypothetical protein
MAGLYGTQLTDELMVNPYMFDPSQLANPYSNYRGAALPYPSTYGGTPVSAATGQPIQSYQQWLQQNPGGMTLNATPAQAQAPGPPPGTIPNLNMLVNGAVASGNYPLAQSYWQQIAGINNPNAARAGPGATGTPAAAPQGSGGPPNNWNAALSALANPGTPAIGGATVPLATGSQPSGGVNAAWLQQAQGRPGMNQNFLAALQAIQGRR